VEIMSSFYSKVFFDFDDEFINIYNKFVVVVSYKVFLKEKMSPAWVFSGSLKL
jgi:hypothetical protein